MGSSFVRAAAACVLLLVATACGGSEQPPKPSGPPELSVADYQQKLDGLVAAIRPLTEQLNPAATLEQVNQVRGRLGAVLGEQHTAFSAFAPPKSAAVPHRALIEDLSSFGTDLRKPISGTGDNSCGVPSPEALSLHEAKVATRKTLGRPTTAPLPEAFTKAGLQFAGWPLPPEPAMPELETRRPGNGELLQRGPGGPTTVTIANNSGKLDAVVFAVAGEDPARPLASVFVRRDSTVTLSGLSVPFELYYKFGNDFDAQRRGFTRDCEYRRVHGALDTPGRWSVGIDTSTLGKSMLLRLTPSGASDYRSVRIAEAAPF
ncbi:hypothetical protein M8C13_15785 [Crossiella sp. SN42]|uniref:hypothetical protein n=1 Tax=Crossiella sp. SN42 TaxID=2944808 RepID=UPI00207CB51E|nr:hypothetical protein [Crossiella sp. SN42]MCO1577217.1 hypothetical protein [Crossiella sp. SN42]